MRIHHCLFFTLAILSCCSTTAEDGASLEYKVKAAFLTNFTQFVEWPEKAFASADAPIVIGVLGDDPFDDTLELASSRKTSHGRKIVIKRYRDAEDAAAAHVLFISNSERAKLGKIVAALKDKPVLLVGESANFMRAGGMVRFMVRDERVQLEINPDAASNAGLRITSKLLRLAQIVSIKDGD